MAASKPGMAGVKNCILFFGTWSITAHLVQESQLCMLPTVCVYVGIIMTYVCMEVLSLS